MAFIRIDPDQGQVALSPGQPALGDGWQEGMSRPAAVAMALAVNGLLLTALYQGVLGTLRPSPPEPEQAPLVVFEPLAYPATVPNESTLGSFAASAPVQEETVDDDIELAPPEWSSVRVPLAVQVAPSVNRSAAASAPAATTGLESTTPPGYDPYAGASPARRGERPDGPFAAYLVDSRLTEDAVAARIRTLLRARFPEARGSIRLTIGFDPEGRIASVIYFAGTLDEDMARQMAHHLEEDGVTFINARGSMILPLLEL